MPVEVFDGSLQFTSSIDLSDTDKMIAELESQLVGVINKTSAANDALAKTANQISTTFNPNSIKEFGGVAEAAVDAITRATSQLHESLGDDKLNELDEKLQNAGSSAEQFAETLKFVKENLANIESDPTKSAAILQNIEGIQTALNQTAQSTQDVAANMETALAGVQTPLGELTEQYNLLDAKATELENRLSTEKDPAALTRINDELGKVYEELDKVQNKFQSFNNPNYGAVPDKPGGIDLKSASEDQLKSNLKDLQEYGEKLREALNLTDNADTAKEYNEQLNETRERITEVTARIAAMDQEAVSATTRLNQLRNELASMSPDDEGYQQLLDEATELENRLRNVRQEISLAGSNTAGITATKQGLNGLVGAFTATSSAIALVSGDSKELQESMAKLFAVITLVSGAEQFMALVSKESAANQYLLALYRRLTGQAAVQQAVATEGVTAAEAANAVATEGATAAQWSLNAAIEANPVGAIIIAITALVGVISLYVNSLEDADDKQIKINDSIAETVGLLNQLSEIQNQPYLDRAKRAQDAVSLAQAQGKSEKEILDLKIKANIADGAAANQRSAFLAADQKQLGLLQAMLEARTSELSSLTALKNSGSDLSKSDTKRLEVLQSTVKAIEAQVSAAKSAVDAVDDAAQKNAELQAEKLRKAKEDALRSSVASAEAAAVSAPSNTKAELDAQISAIKARTSAELTNVNLTEGERRKIRANSLKEIDDLERSYRIKEIEDQEAAAKALIASSEAGSVEEYNAKVALIKLAAQKQLQEAGITQNKINEINAEAIKSESDLRKKHGYELAQIAIGQQIAETNGKIAESKKWSDEELQLRKNLIDQQADLDIAAAESSISNAELLAIKENQIHAKSLADKKKLDDQYADKRLQFELNSIRAIAEQQNIASQKILNDPTKNNTQKYNAQRNILENEQTALLQMWLAADKAANSAKGNTEKAAQEAAKYKAQLDQVGDAIENLDKEHIRSIWQGISQVAQQLGSSITSLGASISELNSDLGETITGIGSLMSGAGELSKMFDESTSTVDKYATAIQGVVQLMALVASSAAQRARAEREFNESLINEQLQYNLALQGAILLNSKLKDNVFLVNYQGQLKDGIKAITNAQKSYQEAIKALEKGQAKAGQRNAINGNSILSGIGSGALIGAAVGSIVPVIGNVVGGVVGAIAGGIAGLFGGKKKKDVYVSLLQEYPKLVQQTADGVLQIDKNLAQTLINNKLVSDSTKQLIQDTIDWQEEIDKANEQIKGIIYDLAGDLGGDLRNSLVDAFEQGTDSAKAFAESVSKTLDNVLSQLIFNNVFGDAFDNLQKEMQDSFGQNGDNNWEDDLTEFFTNYVGLTDKFNEQIKKAQEEAANAGLSIFQDPNKSDGSNTLAGAIKGITEQQADLLAGQFGGLRISMIQQVQICTQQLNVLNSIDSNTSKLRDIQADIRSIKTLGIKIIK